MGFGSWETPEKGTNLTIEDTNIVKTNFTRLGFSSAPWHPVTVIYEELVII